MTKKKGESQPKKQGDLPNMPEKSKLGKMADVFFGHLEDSKNAQGLADVETDKIMLEMKSQGRDLFVAKHERMGSYRFEIVKGEEKLKISKERKLRGNA